MPTMRRSMSTKLPDSGRSDQRVSAVTWNSTIIPLPRLAAVTSGVPSASVAQVRSARPASGSASTWRVTLTSFGTGMLPNGPSLREGGERLRLVPAQAAAERAAAAAKLHRHEIVVGAGEARAGETHQHAAVLDPGDEPVARLARDIADVGQHDHRQVLLDEAAHRVGGRRHVGEPHVGERVERAGQVIGRGEQRLRGVGGRAGDDADGAAAPALVEQLHGAGRALAGDLEPRDVVADLDRQVDLGVGLALVVLEGEARFAERQAFQVERADDAVLGAAGRGAQHLHGKRAGGIVGGGERMRGRQRRRSTTETVRPSVARARPVTNSEPRPRSTPSESQITSMSGVAARKREIVGSASVRSTACGLGLSCLQPHARGGRRLQRDVAAGFAERDDARRRGCRPRRAR